METELIERARGGDQEALRGLIERYGGLAQRTAIAFLQERTAAEDAVQDAWMDAWRGLSRFDPAQPFRPWLLTLVANRCRMQLRRRRLALLPFASAFGIAATAAAESDPAQTMLGLDPALAAALAALDAEQRRLLALRFYADLELAEIARVLGVPLGTVKSRLHRTLQQLRVLLAREATAAKGIE